MVPLRKDAPTTPPPPLEVSAEALQFLNHLRFTALQCRAKRRADLFEACALLHASRSASQQAHAEALMRCLSQALGKPALLFAPGTSELSFDESWLLQLGLASAHGDHASLNFLLKSRVAHEHRRLVLFLITRISECFSLN